MGTPLYNHMYRQRGEEGGVAVSLVIQSRDCLNIHRPNTIDDEEERREEVGRRRQGTYAAPSREKTQTVTSE